MAPPVAGLVQKVTPAFAGMRTVIESEDAEIADQGPDVVEREAATSRRASGEHRAGCAAEERLGAAPLDTAPLWYIPAYSAFGSRCPLCAPCSRRHDTRTTKMDSVERTPQTLFEGEKVYRVPLYQRLYVWNETDQWGPLWEDIATVAEAVAAKKSISPHFFGALILKSTEDSGVWRVIDGQQRLTTMQLAIAAVADELTHRKADLKVAAPLRELIVNPKYAWDKHRYKMQHSGNNYVGFVGVMAANGNETAIAEIGGEMSSCYLFFRRKARTWLDTNPTDDAANDLTLTLRTKLQTVAIQLRADEPEHSIFETLNARGVALTEWDKIRNYLLYRTEADEDYFFRKYLEPFDEPWWRTITGSGADRRPRTDRFVDYWLESRLHRSVPASRVFRAFQTHTEDRNNDDLITDIELLTRDAQYYRRFEFVSEHHGEFESVFHARRRYMRLGSFWPLLLGMNQDFVDQAERILVLRSLDSWSVRRWICGPQTRNYPDIVLGLLKLVSPEGQSSGAARRIIDRLDAIGRTRWPNRWPDDGEVRAAILEKRQSLWKNRMLLESVERHIAPPRAGSEMKTADLQVEHVMPIKWEATDWHMDEDTEERRTERNHLIGTLGNLTVIHGSLNSSIGNAAWITKRKAIKKFDNLFLNKDLLERAPRTWNEDAIRERGEWLAKKVCEIWPHADALRRRLGRE